MTNSSPGQEEDAGKVSAQGPCAPSGAEGAHVRRGRDRPAHGPHHLDYHDGTTGSGRQGAYGQGHAWPGRSDTAATRCCRNLVGDSSHWFATPVRRHWGRTDGRRS